MSSLLAGRAGRVLAITASSLLLSLPACGGGSSGTGGSGTAGAGGATTASSSTGGGGSTTGTGGMGTGGMGTGGMGTGGMGTGGSDVLLSGPGYGLVYIAPAIIGIDSRPSVDATFDAGGYFIGYTWSANEHLAIGAATDPSKGHDALAAWGAWTGGPTTGMFYAGQPNGDFTWDPSTEGFHYAIGKITDTASLPASGVVTYALAGGSAPTRATASAPGTLDAVTATMDFGTGSLSVTISVTMPDGPGSLVTTGTLANAGAYKVVSGSGSGSLRGIFVGPTAERLVLVYGMPNQGSTVIGSAVVQ